jgi:hypothetical protein
MNNFLVLIDIAAGVFFLSRAFVAVAHMSLRTRHSVRMTYVLLTVGAMAMLISPFADQDWRRYAHMAVISALALQALFDCRHRYSDADAYDHLRAGTRRDLA